MGIDNQIVQTLESMSVDNKVPHGTFAEVAKRFNLSRQRIHQIAKKHGIESEQIKSHVSRCCSNCGQVIPKGQVRDKRLRCQDCTTPLISCSNCGKLFRRHVGSIIRAVQGNGRYKGQAFLCSWECRNAWMKNIKE